MANQKIIAACVSCGNYMELPEITAEKRCLGCQELTKLAGRFGSMLVNGAMTQRELAEVKREFYQLYQVDQALEQRRVEFMQKAQEEMQRVIDEVEAQVGQPLKQLRDKKKMLEAQLKTFMEESQTAKMRIRDLLVEVQEQVINRGNMPQYKQIIGDLREILKWSEEEMETFVRARYSQPQTGNVMTVKPLPKKTPPVPGKPVASCLGEEGYADPDMIQVGSVMAFHTPYLDLPTMAVIQSEFTRSGAKICKVSTEEDVFILTGSRVADHGLPAMLSLQAKTKATLKVADVKQNRDGSMHVLVEGEFAYDPNTLRAFLAERCEGYEIADQFNDSATRVAVELKPIEKVANSPLDAAMAFFNHMTETVQSLMMLERQRSEAAQNIATGNTGGAFDGIDMDDLSLKYERNQPAGGQEGSFGTGNEEGVMTPHGKSPLTQTA